jgi:coatomer subunit beta'
MPQHNRIYLLDKQFALYAFTLSLAVVEYQTAILRNDLPAAEALLPEIPREQRSRVARFLEARGLKELAYEVTPDPDHRFELALALDDLDAAASLARELPAGEARDKWRQVGDAALAVWRVDLAREAYDAAEDLSALLLLLLSTGERKGLQDLAAKASKWLVFVFIDCVFTDMIPAEQGQNNLALAALLQLGDTSGVTDLLLATHRAPEAALFARTYAPRYIISSAFVG